MFFDSLNIEILLQLFLSHFDDFMIFVYFHLMVLEKLIIAVCVLVMDANFYSFQLDQKNLMDKGNLVFD